MPQFEMAAGLLGADGGQEDDLAADSEESEDDRPPTMKTISFGAAYEDVTYRDSTDDGVEGEVFEGGESPTDFELVGEAERIVSRLSFLTTVAQLWKLVATASRWQESGHLSRRPARRSAGRLARSGGAKPRATAGAFGLGASPSHSAAARHAGVAGRIRPPAERQGDVAGGDHPNVRRDGRRGER